MRSNRQPRKEIVLADAIEELLVETLGEDQHRQILGFDGLPLDRWRKQAAGGNYENVIACLDQARRRIGLNGCNVEEIAKAAWHDLKRIHLLRNAIDQRVYGLATRADSECHFIAKAFIDIGANVSIRGRPLKIDVFVKVFVCVFPDCVIAKIAANLSRLYLEGGGCKFRRRLDFEVVLLACRKDDECDDDHDRDEQHARHRKYDAPRKIFAGEFCRIGTENAHGYPRSG